MEEQKIAEEVVKADEKVEAATPSAATETSEDLKAQLEAEQAMRALAEEERDNAKKDIIAIKTGKKRDAVNLKETKTEAETPAPAPSMDSELAKELAETRRINAELARALAARGVAPTGGSGSAESPAPKPKSYWSEEQKSVLKKRGWSDAKISRAENTARTGSASAAKYAEDAGVQKRTY